MENLTIRDSSCTDNPSTAQTDWVQAHGSLKSLAKTFLRSGKDGDLIISTAIVSSGHSFVSGFFIGVETRVFGGRRNGLSEFFESTGDPQDGFRLAIKEHTQMIERIVGFYLSD